MGPPFLIPEFFTNGKVYIQSNTVYERIIRLEPHLTNTAAACGGASATSECIPPFY